MAIFENPLEKIGGRFPESTSVVDIPRDTTLDMTRASHLGASLSIFKNHQMGHR
jgi:hypothetical protein